MWNVQLFSLDFLGLYLRNLAAGPTCTLMTCIKLSASCSPSAVWNIMGSLRPFERVYSVRFSGQNPHRWVVQADHDGCSAISTWLASIIVCENVRLMHHVRFPCKAPKKERTLPRSCVSGMPDQGGPCRAVWISPDGGGSTCALKHLKQTVQPY